MTIVMATGTFDLIHPGHGLFLEEAKKFGGKDTKLVVVLARDSTVRSKKRIPIINENQRLEVVKMLKPVDEAYLGSETNMFEIVGIIKPDIIAIGPDQKFDVETLQKDLQKSGYDVKVKRVTRCKRAPLDSSCKIIKKIRDLDFGDEAFKDCVDK